jgi:hypothetical protein
MPATPKRRTAVGLLVAAGLAAAALLAVFGLPCGSGHREAFAHVYTFPGNGNTTQLHIDADITNGSRPCDPIDDTATVGLNSVHRVGVCIENYVPNSIEFFELHIRYSGNPDATPPTTINNAPTVTCTSGTGDANCLNANPNANDGNDDVTGLTLGYGWSCTGFGFSKPLGEDPSTPGVADARIFCNADIVSPDKDLTANPGLLATIQFNVTGTGIDTIDFGPIDDTNLNAVGKPRATGDGYASCGSSVAEEQVGCFGATVHKMESLTRTTTGCWTPGRPSMPAITRPSLTGTPTPTRTEPPTSRSSIPAPTPATRTRMGTGCRTATRRLTPA